MATIQNTPTTIVKYKMQQKTNYFSDLQVQDAFTLNNGRTYIFGNRDDTGYIYEVDEENDDIEEVAVRSGMGYWFQCEYVSSNDTYYMFSKAGGTPYALYSFNGGFINRVTYAPSAETIMGIPIQFIRQTDDFFLQCGGNVYAFSSIYGEWTKKVSRHEGGLQNWENYPPSPVSHTDFPAQIIIETNYYDHEIALLVSPSSYFYLQGIGSGDSQPETLWSNYYTKEYKLIGGEWVHHIDYPTYEYIWIEGPMSDPFLTSVKESATTVYSADSLPMTLYFSKTTTKELDNEADDPSKFQGLCLASGRYYTFYSDYNPYSTGKVIKICDTNESAWSDAGEFLYEIYDLYSDIDQETGVSYAYFSDSLYVSYSLYDRGTFKLNYDGTDATKINSLVFWDIRMNPYTYEKFSRRVFGEGQTEIYSKLFTETPILVAKDDYIDNYNLIYSFGETTTIYGNYMEHALYRLGLDGSEYITNAIWEGDYPNISDEMYFDFAFATPAGNIYAWCTHSNDTEVGGDLFKLEEGGSYKQKIRVRNMKRKDAGASEEPSESSPYVQWDGYPQSPVLTSEYPYQFILDLAGRIHLILGHSSFYLSGDTISADDLLYDVCRYYDIRGWKIVAENETVHIPHDEDAIVLQSNRNIYTDSTLSEIYFVGNETSVSSEVRARGVYCKTGTGTNTFPPSIKTYGVRIDNTNSNPETGVEYTDDAVGMTGGSTTWDTLFPFLDIKPCLLKEGVVQYYLNPNNYSQKADGSASDITSGTDGDVMIEIPKMAYSMKTVGNYLYVKVTNNPAPENNIDGTEDWCFHAHTRNEAGDCANLYIGAYLGSTDGSTKLRSLSGKTPTRAQTIETFRTRAQANGTDYDQISFYPLTLLQCLYLIRYKNRDSQTALGRGFVDGDSAATNTGGANTHGMYYGEATGKQQMKFAGIEDFWGNLSYYIDGLFSNSTRNILTAFSSFNDTGSGYADRGQGATSDIGKYMSVCQGTSATGFIPKTVAGSGSTYFCDRAYLYASCLPHFGGFWGSLSTTGAFQIALDVPSAGSGSGFGGRLMYLSSNSIRTSRTIRINL